MIGGLVIMIFGAIVMSIAGAISKSNRTVYENEEDKQDLALRYAVDKYGELKTYKYRNRDWEVDDISIGYANKEGTPLFLHLKRGVWPINDTTDVAEVEILSDAILTKMLEEENKGADSELLNKAKQL